MTWNRTGFLFREHDPNFHFQLAASAFRNNKTYVRLSKTQTFLHFFTKQLLFRRNMQALKEVFFCGQNSNVEFDCEIPLFLVDPFA